MNNAWYLTFYQINFSRSEKVEIQSKSCLFPKNDHECIFLSQIGKAQIPFTTSTLNQVTAMETVQKREERKKQVVKEKALKAAVVQTERTKKKSRKTNSLKKTKRYTNLHKLYLHCVRLM